MRFGGLAPRVMRECGEFINTLKRIETMHNLIIHTGVC